jgi:hypothetical protein
MPHLLEFSPNERHNVLPADTHGLSRSVAQCHVQRRSFLSEVDRIASKKFADALLEFAPAGQLDQQIASALRNTLPGVVEQQLKCLKTELIKALGIVRKQLPQVQILDLGCVLLT